MNRLGYAVPLFSSEHVLKCARVGRSIAGARPMVATSAQTEDARADKRFAEANPAIDDLYRARLLRTRSTPPAQKLVETMLLSEQSAARMKAGIRIRRPEADDIDCTRIVRQQLEQLRRLEDRAFYLPITGDGR